MEEQSPLIRNFLKRFKATYPDNINELDKLSMVQGLEFILDCYCTMWQSILGSSNYSMLSIFMKVSNPKNFTLNKNDLRTKNRLDFLTSSAANDSPEIMLFCAQVGIQPKHTTKISAGQCLFLFMTKSLCTQKKHVFSSFSLGPHSNLSLGHDLLRTMFKIELSHRSERQSISKGSPQ